MLATEGLLGKFQQINLIETQQAFVTILLNYNLVFYDSYQVLSKFIPSCCHDTLQFLHMVHRKEVATTFAQQVTLNRKVEGVCIG